ncbi:CLUMA_CG011050, isoform D [Clunio marinus]|uniref:dolichol kinase n=1 Tax=Clunio marinus TaxID=568069 RepID=A0A1J1IF95_9DIPT|nr:CLUMA_CG011050, isoform D [Clunio marinus]
MTSLFKTLDKNCKSSNIQLRPNGSNGLWLIILLFICFLQTILRNPATIQINYELLTVLLFGMSLQTISAIFIVYIEEIHFISKVITKLIPTVVVSLILNLVLKQDVLFSITTSFIVLTAYHFIYIFLMKSLPFSFTLGEAAVVAQGISLFLYNFYLKIPTLREHQSPDQSINSILSIGIFGIIVIVLTVRIAPVFRKWPMFYLLLITITFMICIFPIDNKISFIILIDFITNDIDRILIVGVYVGLLLIAGFAVCFQIRKNQKGSTSNRKIFHILIVMVYVPGLIYQCHLLYVASVIIFAIFIILEVARVIELYPVASILETSVEAFIDEKDAGKVVLTPIYLLVGCSLPMWIHNSPCDLLGSSSTELLPLLSGVLSIGIGDTFASFIGSRIGKHKWFKSAKSVEGTLANIIAQASFLYLLHIMKVISLDMKLMAISGVAILLNSLVEALTDQVDNLKLRM